MKMLVLWLGLAAVVATVGCEATREGQPGAAGGTSEGYNQSSGSSASDLNAQPPPRNYQGYTNSNPYPFH